MLNVKTNSKLIKKGDVFICTRDGYSNRHLFIKDAYLKGAKCIVADEDISINLDIPIIKVNNTNDVLYQIYNDYYNKPFDSVKLIGITGTDGKTTTAIMIKNLLDSFVKTAYMGTNGFIIDNNKTPIRNTTPAIDEILKRGNISKKCGVQFLVMEASSEGLMHDRCRNLLFNYAILTNITGDHLNAHKSFSNYIESKFKLFKQIKSDGYAILNMDDQHYNYFKKTKAKRITYGFNNKADYRIFDIIENENSTVFSLKHKNKAYKINSPYIGKFNVYDLTACIALINNLGVDIEKLIPLIKNLSPIDGRNKILNFGQDYKIILDYAHTINATKEILGFANRIKKNRIITVVGCAGGRETEKRKDIGKIVSDLSDNVIFTMDDPRYEKVTDIISEMTQNIKDKNYKIIVNRKKAIKKALDMAQKNDIVLILGKGEDNYMAIKNKYKKYSDLKIVSNYFN